MDTPERDVVDFRLFMEAVLSKATNLNLIVIISGALRITPTVALEIILDLPLLDLYCKKVAAGIVWRIWATRQQRGSLKYPGEI